LLVLELFPPVDPSSLALPFFANSAARKFKSAKSVNSLNIRETGVKVFSFNAFYFLFRVLAVRLFVFVCLANELSKFNNERNFAAH